MITSRGKSHTPLHSSALVAIVIWSGLLLAFTPLSVDPEAIPVDKVAAENKWWKDLGASVPTSIVRAHPWSKPYSGHSLIVPRSMFAEWFNNSNPNLNAAELRADLPLLRLVMEKNYSGWEIARDHGWNWESWFKAWDSALGEAGNADMAPEKAFAPWSDYQRFQLDNHSGPVKQDLSVRSQSAVLAELPDRPCQRMKMQDGTSYPIVANDLSQQPHRVYLWDGSSYLPAAYISYPANRGHVVSLDCGPKTVSASVFSSYSANDKPPAISPLVPAPADITLRNPFYSSLGPGIGYFRLPGFAEAQNEMLRKMIPKLPAEAGHETAIVFDLRGNGGGDAPLWELRKWIYGSYVGQARTLDHRVKKSCFLPGLRFGLMQMLTWRVEPPVSGSLLTLINQNIRNLSEPVPEDCPVSFQDSKATWNLSQHHFDPHMHVDGRRIILLVDSGCGSDCEYFVQVVAAVPGSVIVGGSTFGLAGFTQPGYFYLPHSHVVFRIATSVTRPYGDNRTIDGYGLSADVILPSGDALTKESIVKLIKALNIPPQP